MGQKVNPIGMRLKITNDWSSKWYARPSEYADILHEDLKIRQILLTSPLSRSGEISNIEIIRHPQRVTAIVHTARPGIIIGSKGENIEKIKKVLHKYTSSQIYIKIKEVKNPEINAQIIALNIARQLRMKSAFRRSMKMAMDNAFNNSILGIRLKISGRLGGAEMSRSLSMIRGRMPLHTLRADISYGFAESRTTYGVIGVKVWIFHKEIYKKKNRDDAGLLLKRNNSAVSEKVARTRSGSNSADAIPVTASVDTTISKNQSADSVHAALHENDNLPQNRQSEVAIK